MIFTMRSILCSRLDTWSCSPPWLCAHPPLSPGRWAIEIPMWRMNTGEPSDLLTWSNSPSAASATAPTRRDGPRPGRAAAGAAIV